MVNQIDLEHYINQLLASDGIQDYCPNGLQVAGKSEIKSIVCGVTACQALLEAAIEAQADAVIVHHGYFWRNESQPITGMKYERIKTLINHDLNLFAYHLPLDIHTTLGNNVTLARVLDINVTHQEGADGIDNLLWFGELAIPKAGTAFSEHIAQALGREPLHIAGSDKMIQRVGWCTGGAQKYIDLAAKHVDAYITGEASEGTVHSAREQGVHFFAAGHHATERYGVQALGEHLAEKFDLTYQFIDIDNPV